MCYIKILSLALLEESGGTKQTCLKMFKCSLKQVCECVDDHIYIDFKRDASCTQPRGQLLGRDRLRPNVSECVCVKVCVLNHSW